MGSSSSSSSSSTGGSNNCGCSGRVVSSYLLVINSVLVGETGAKLKTYLDVCMHCGLCSDACSVFLSNDRNPVYSPAGKIKQTIGVMIKKKGRV